MVFLLLLSLLFSCGEKVSPENQSFSLSDEVLRFSPEIEEGDRLTNSENLFGSFFAAGDGGVYLLYYGMVFFHAEGEKESVELFPINHQDGKFAYTYEASIIDPVSWLTVFNNRGMSYRDGRLYFLCSRKDGKDFQGDSLISVQSDGSDLKIEHNFNVPFGISYVRGFLHRDSFFYFDYVDKVDPDGLDQGLKGHRLRRLYLDTKEDVPLDLPFTMDKVYSIGNYLVFSDFDSKRYKEMYCDYYVYDLSTSTVHPMGLKASREIPWFQDRIMTESGGKLISFEPRTGKIEEHFETRAINF